MEWEFPESFHYWLHTLVIFTKDYEFDPIKWVLGYFICKIVSFVPNHSWMGLSKKSRNPVSIPVHKPMKGGMQQVWYFYNICARWSCVKHDHTMLLFNYFDQKQNQQQQQEKSCKQKVSFKLYKNSSTSLALNIKDLNEEPHFYLIILDLKVSN